ncbi:MAG TPA: hypothetical protein PLO61_02120 [Fimbriimonadaceae bacterium]|nr:hypothetical protein [Fimbriimonadaceae bacterium]HRJ32324.1 hypothetical protein [Fimbriimonadaceae bacterium]
MKALTILAWLLAGGGLLGLIGSWAVPAWYRPQAQLIQRVQLNEAEYKLFGTLGDYVGSPQKMIISDPKAFLEGKTGPNGSKLVSEDYLVQNKIYPLQLQTIEFFAEMVRYSSIGAVLVGALGIAWLRRRRRLLVD